MYKAELSERPITALVVLFMLLLVIAASGRMQASHAAWCDSVVYITYYTDSSKTVACGYYDDCSGEFSGCRTTYNTRPFRTCCCCA